MLGHLFSQISNNLMSKLCSFYFFRSRKFIKVVFYLIILYKANCYISQALENKFRLKGDYKFFYTAGQSSGLIFAIIAMISFTNF